MFHRVFCHIRLRSYALPAFSAAALVFAPPAQAQLGIPQLVIDLPGNAKWAEEIVLIGREIGLATQMARDTLTAKDTLVYNMQSFRNKSWWRTVIPPSVRVHTTDVNGKSIDWNVTTGGGYTQPGQVWTNASLNFSQQDISVLNNPNSHIDPNNATNSVILNSAGMRGLATIQQNQQFLNANLPAIQRLQSTILDPGTATNSHTNQLQEISNASGQALSLNIQTLRSQNAQLEISTGIAKIQAETETSRAQALTREALMRQQSKTHIGGMADALQSHP